MIRFGTSSLVPNDYQYGLCLFESDRFNPYAWVRLSPTGAACELRRRFAKNLVRTKLAGGGRRIRTLDSSWARPEI